MALHWATFCTTCLASLLRDNLHKTLPGITYPVTDNSHILPQPLQKVELQHFFQTLPSVTPLAMIHATFLARWEIVSRLKCLIYPG